MLKLIASIVDTRRNLVGFIMEGKEKEFGGMSNNKMQNAVSIKSMIQNGFNNNQIAVSGNKIVEKNNFKINSLNMCVFNGTDYIPVDNTINLTKRFVQNNENIGFEVAFSDGTALNFKYEQVISLATWFKPGNFMIRTSATNKNFISGKPGFAKLSELPVVQLGEESKAKRTKSSAKEKKQEFNGSLPNGFDILDIYGFIDACGGCIINLPTEKYNAADTSSRELDTKLGFVSLGIGEVASAKPAYNASKLNVNAGFKKVGVVNVELNGTKVGVTTFTYRTKSIFLNGENHIKKFGIAVPSDREEALVKALGGSLALVKITDDKVTGPISNIINAESLVFYTVDTGSIDLISPKKQQDSILSSVQLVDLLKQRFEYNLITKFCGAKAGIIKEIKDELGSDEVAKVNNKKPFGIFSAMNTEALVAIRDAGIDIYTGEFNSSRAAKELGIEVKTASKAAKAEDDTVVIEYVLKGYDANKITFKNIKEAALTRDTTKIPSSVLAIANEIMSVADLKERLKLAQKYYSIYEAKLDETTKKLWMHNASMYIVGSKSRIHSHDRMKWSVDASSRVKNAVAYTCAEPGAEGLTLKVYGVSI